MEALATIGLTAGMSLPMADESVVI